MSILRVHAEHVALLRRWLGRLNGPRRDEALMTLLDEGCRHEMAMLIEGNEGPLVVYAMEVEDLERSKQAAVESRHPIDTEHQRIMHTAVARVVPGELLLDLRPD